MNFVKTKSNILASAVAFAVLLTPVTASCQFFFMDNEDIGKPVKDFTLKRVGKDEISLTEYLDGQKGVVFFWATWCPHCRAQLKELSANKEKIKQDKIKVVLVDVGESEPMVAKYMQKIGIEYDVFLDMESSVSEEYGIVGVPTFYFVDEEGIVRDVDHALPKDFKKVFKES